MSVNNKLAAIIHSNLATIGGYIRPSVTCCDSEKDARRTAQANFGVASYPSRYGRHYSYVAAYSGKNRVETAQVDFEWDPEEGELRFYFR